MIKVDEKVLQTNEQTDKAISRVAFATENTQCCLQTCSTSTFSR